MGMFHVGAGNLAKSSREAAKVNLEGAVRVKGVVSSREGPKPLP